MVMLRAMLRHWDVSKIESHIFTSGMFTARSIEIREARLNDMRLQWFLFMPTTRIHVTRKCGVATLLFGQRINVLAREEAMIVHVAKISTYTCHFALYSLAKDKPNMLCQSLSISHLTTVAMVGLYIRRSLKHCRNQQRKRVHKSRLIWHKNMTWTTTLISSIMHLLTCLLRTDKHYRVSLDWCLTAIYPDMIHGCVIARCVKVMRCGKQSSAGLATSVWVVCGDLVWNHGAHGIKLYIKSGSPQYRNVGCLFLLQLRW